MCLLQRTRPMPCGGRGVPRRGWTVGVWLVFVVAASVVGVPLAAAERAGEVVTEDVSFRGGDGETLNGTVVSPPREDVQLPGVVLVHGAGPGLREWHRQEAEAFARAGIVAMIYDKRTEGYSLTERSYSQLADDALGAVDVLRRQDHVDPARVGLWGVSEGGWVAPLAAARSLDVDFVVVVGGSAVPPAQQEAWAKANRLRLAGVSSSMVRAYATRTVRLLVDAGLFPEASYDPVAALERLRQPVLAIWGEHEEVSPPAESMSIYAEALGRGKTVGFTLRVLADADHAGYHAPDGESSTSEWITTRGEFAAGYIESMTRWIDELADAPPLASAETPPQQAVTSTPLQPLAWYESAPVQLGVVLVILAGFASYPFIAVVQRFRGTRQVTPRDRPARWLAGAGLVTVLGSFGYFGFLLLTTEAVLGPVVLGRTIPWITLQLSAAVAVIAAVVTGTVWWRPRNTADGRMRVELGPLLVSTTAFVPWALYWGLLVP